jgi:protein-histidine N-methyltransferase
MNSTSSTIQGNQIPSVPPKGYAMTGHAGTGLIDNPPTFADAGPTDSHEVKMQRFLRWMEEQGATFPAMTIKVGLNGRQVHATRPALSGELIVHVPRKLIITPEDAMASETGKLMKAHCDSFAAQEYMAAYLLEIKHKNGFWKPYIDVLPTDFSHIPCQYSDSELEHLKGSYVFGMATARRKREAYAYDALPPSLKESWLTRDNFMWALSLVKSRVYTLKLGNGITSGIVPLADMFDHDPNKNLRWIPSADAGFVVTAREQIETGAVLSETYGIRCNGRYLNIYGFCLENNSENEAEIVVPSMPVDHPFFEPTKNLGIRRQDMCAFRTPGIFRRPPTQELFSYLRLACLNDTPPSAAPMIDPKKTTCVPAISRDNEIAVLTALAEACERAMQLFPTTIEEDDALLKDEHLTRNVRNAIIVRRGEKIVLKYFLDLAATALPVLRDASSNLSEHAAEGMPFALYFADVDEGLRSWAGMA